MNISKDDVTITKSVKVEVVTSGYSDRFLSTNATFTVKVFTPNGQSATSTVDSRERVIDFLHNLLEFTFEQAFEMFYEVEPQYYISGKPDPKSFVNRNLTPRELNTIVTYLKFYHGHGFKADYRLEMEEELKKYPLPADVLAIVQWQIAECDRKNIETWGHKNGREGAKDG